MRTRPAYDRSCGKPSPVHSRSSGAMAADAAVELSRSPVAVARRRRNRKLAGRGVREDQLRSGCSSLATEASCTGEVACRAAVAAASYGGATPRAGAAPGASMPVDSAGVAGQRAGLKPGELEAVKGPWRRRRKPLAADQRGRVKQLLVFIVLLGASRHPPSGRDGQPISPGRASSPASR